jgi:hypothetical protein
MKSPQKTVYTTYLSPPPLERLDSEKKIRNSKRLRVSKVAAACMTGFAIMNAAVGVKAQTVIDRYFTIQPIQVCNNAGANCAPTPLFQAETEKIYTQAGAAPVFLPTTQLNNTNLLNLIDVDGDGNYLDEIDLSGNGRSANPTTINTWFVRDFVASPGLFGEGWINANGVVIDGTDVQNFNSGNGRRDTIAHEIGHNFGLRHNNFGAGGANNLMTAGGSRTIPDGVANINPDGAQLSQLTQAQIDQIRSSPLLNQVPEVIVDTNGSTPFNTNDFFLVDFQNGASGVFLESLTLDITPVNAFFDSVSSGPLFQFPGGDGSPFALSNLNGINAANITLVGGNNSLDGGQKLTLNFAPNSFTVGDSFRFGIDIDLFSKIDQEGAMPSELIGSLFSFTFSDGFSLQAEIENDLIASSIKPSNILPFNGQPMGGPQIPPGTITDPPDPEPVPEPGSTAAILLVGISALYSRMRRRSVSS